MGCTLTSETSNKYVTKTLIYKASADVEVFKYLNGHKYLRRKGWALCPCPSRSLPEADLHGDTNARRSRCIASSLDRLVLPSLLKNEPEIVKETIFPQSVTSSIVQVCNLHLNQGSSGIWYTTILMGITFPITGIRKFTVHSSSRHGHLYTFSLLCCFLTTCVHFSSILRTDSKRTFCLT